LPPLRWSLYATPLLTPTNSRLLCGLPVGDGCRETAQPVSVSRPRARQRDNTRHSTIKFSHSERCIPVYGFATSDGRLGQLGPEIHHGQETSLKRQMHRANTYSLIMLSGSRPRGLIMPSPRGLTNATEFALCGLRDPDPFRHPA
jgi:hypothetical protein